MESQRKRLLKKLTFIIWQELNAKEVIAKSKCQRVNPKRSKFKEWRRGICNNTMTTRINEY